MTYGFDKFCNVITFLAIFHENQLIGSKF